MKYYLYIVLFGIFSLAAFVPVSAQSVPQCDCSKFEGTCSASIQNFETQGKGQLFSLRFDMTSSVPDRCALTVLRYPNGDLYGTVTIQGGFDQGIWGYPREFDYSKLRVESCDVCAIPVDVTKEENQDLSDLEEDLLSLVNNDQDSNVESESEKFRQISRQKRDDGSLLYSQLSDEERRLKYENLSERSKASNSQLLNTGLDTLQTVNAHVNESRIPTGTGLRQEESNYSNGACISICNQFAKERSYTSIETSSCIERCEKTTLDDYPSKQSTISNQSSGNTNVTSAQSQVYKTPKSNKIYQPMDSNGKSCLSVNQLPVKWYNSYDKNWEPYKYGSYDWKVTNSCSKYVTMEFEWADGVTGQKAVPPNGSTTMWCTEAGQKRECSGGFTYNFYINR